MRAEERLRKVNRMLVIDKKATGRKITEQMERSGKNVYEMAKAIGSQANKHLNPKLSFDDVIADKSKQ